MADERPTIVPPAVPPAAAAESSPVTSSPVSITGGRPKLGPRRQSRFTEEPMTTQTPASSISVPSFDVGPHGLEQHPAVRNYSNLSVVHNNINNSPSINHVDSFESAPRAPSDPPAANAEDVKTAIRGLLRTLNSILHSVPCLLLLYIMGMSLKALKKDWVDRRNVQALIFLAVTMLDCLLDVLVLFLIKRPWANWELCARFFFGILYLAQFFVYIGFGSNVFKEGYTYWNMSESGGVAFAFVLMWWLSVWNLLHPVVCRWTAIKLVLSKNASSGPLTANAVDADAAGNRINQIRRPSCFSEQRPTSFNPRLSTVGTEGTVSMVSLTWRRWISRTRSSHFSRDFDVEAGVGTSYQNSRSRRGTVDEGVQMQHQQQQHDQMPSALVSAEDITLKGDDIGSGHHHIHDDLDDDDDDYEKRAGSSLVQKRSTSRLGGGNGEDEDDDDYDEDYEKGRAGAGTGGGGGGGVIKKDEESGSRGVESGKRPKDVGQ